MPRSERYDNIGYAVAITAVLYGIFIVFRIAMHGGDPSGLVMAGDVYCDRAATPKALFVQGAFTGYDGQFYYRMALAPFSAEKIAYGIAFDAPALRQQRILYPLLACILSVGKPAFASWALIAVNYFGLCLLAALGALFARALGKPAAWGLLFPFYAGFVLTVSRDLTEIVAACIMIAGLLAARRGRDGWASAAFSAGIFARETVLLCAVAYAAAQLFRSSLPMRDRIRKALLYTIPCAVYAVWQILLWRIWGESALAESAGTLDIPFAGLAAFCRFIWPPTGPSGILFGYELILLTSTFIVTATIFRASRAEAGEKMALLLYAALALCFSFNRIWVDDWNFMRALTEVYLLAVIVLMASESRLRNVLFAAWILLTLYFMGNNQHGLPPSYLPM